MRTRTTRSPEAWGGVNWATVAHAIARREPGTYEISELLSEHWQREKRPKLYGSIFKRMVLECAFPRVRWIGEKRDGHQVYEVDGARRQVDV
jgi:hypothetical protein